MKKLAKIVLALAVISAVAFTGCSKKASTAKSGDNSLENLKAKGTFILGLDDSFPPLGFRDENNVIVGYDIDLAREVCKRLGVELICQPIDWDSKEQELANGKIDCIWNGLTMTEERIASMEFTKPYLNNAQVVVVRADSGINTLAELSGKTIGIQSGSSAQDALDDSPKFKDSLKDVVEFNENITALNDLEIKRIDGVVMDLIVANYSITTTGKPYKVLNETLSPEQYGVAFKKGNVALAAEVQKTLEAMEKDGTVAAICDKWYGTNLSVIGK